MADENHGLRLQALLTFEMAARHGSFTRAAAALGVSQPAVSHTICSLESGLGVQLFDRLHKGVRLSDAGRYLYEQVGLGLTLIDDAVREVRKFSASDLVTLSASTATATWWLLPRVAGFKRTHPQIEIRCITADTDVDVSSGGIDLAITLGRGEWSRHSRWRMFDEDVFPVCSPGYARELGDPVTLQSLCGATLLHFEERYRPRINWTDWLGKFGLSFGRTNMQLRFTDYSVVLHAALDGQGVALGWRHIVTPLIEQGRLVRPVAEHVVTGHPIYIIAAPNRHMRPATVTVRDWLLAESSADRFD
jgi:DNA-binding transcriptional LysR family regulator